MMTISRLAAAALATFVSTQAYAATCSVDEAAAFSPLIDPAANSCIALTGGDTRTVVNDLALFGGDDWDYLGRDAAFLNGLGTTDLGDVDSFTVSGDGQSGTVTIHNDAYDQYMLAIRGPGVFFAYLIEGSVIDYVSPFFNDNGGASNIAQITLYFRDLPEGTTAPVPLPAGLPLALTGLAGLAGLRLRGRTKV